MSVNVYGFGRVGRDGLGPQASLAPRQRNGGTVQEMFRRCHVFVPTGRRNEGDDRPRSTLIQLIFEPHHEKIFNYLAPGRQITFRGRLSHRPRVSFDTKKMVDGRIKPEDIQVHANPVCHVERIEFVDRPIEQDADRFLQILLEEGKITEEDKQNYVGTIVGKLMPEDPASAAEKAEPAEAQVVDEEDPFVDGDEA